MSKEGIASMMAGAAEKTVKPTMDELHENIKITSGWIEALEASTYTLEHGRKVYGLVAWLKNQHEIATKDFEQLKLATVTVDRKRPKPQEKCAVGQGAA